MNPAIVPDIREVVGYSVHASQHRANQKRAALSRLQSRENAAVEPIQWPTPEVERQIIEMADELALANDPRETSQVIKNRMQIPERVIDRVLDRDRIRHKQEKRILRRFVHDGLIASAQAGRAAAEEIR